MLYAHAFRGGNLTLAVSAHQGDTTLEGSVTANPGEITALLVPRANFALTQVREAFQVKFVNFFIWTSCPLSQAAKVTNASNQYGHKKHIKR